jgi:hypothetical protein
LCSARIPSSSPVSSESQEWSCWHDFICLHCGKGGLTQSLPRGTRSARLLSRPAPPEYRPTRSRLTQDNQAIFKPLRPEWDRNSVRRSKSSYSRLFGHPKKHPASMSQVPALPNIRRA